MAWCALLLALAANARAVTIAWSPVGNPGNTADLLTGSLYGAVPYSYYIDKYDVTNSQYAEFLNAKDADGLNAVLLYNSSMRIDFNRSNASGSKYSVSSGYDNRPVFDVTFYDALRFANWMTNGQGNGDTETGAYTLLGGNFTPSNADSITRNAGAGVFLPNENEWYKAAYYNPVTSSYFQFPTSSNTPPHAGVPTGAINSANYNAAVGGPTDVGAYTGTTSPYGAYDMGGDVRQWNETLIGNTFRGARGGWWNDNSTVLVSSHRGVDIPTQESPNLGFRLAMIVPEPSSLILAGLGLAGLAALAWRRTPLRPS